MTDDLFSRALEALQACDPDRKVELTERLAADWQTGRLVL